MLANITFSKEFNWRRFCRISIALVIALGAMWLLFGLQVPRRFTVIDYAPNTLVYSDRDYASFVDSVLLEGTSVVLLPRHRLEPIWVVADAPVVVYRMIATENDNSVFREYATSDVPVFVKGESCNMDELVFKRYPAGAYPLPCGGPVATSPMLLHCDGRVRAEERMSVVRWAIQWLARVRAGDA
jgi:hypothetical protein